MRCEEARPLISAGLDEELEGARAVMLQAHVAECVHCSQERDALAETVRMLRGLPEAEPPPELRRRIRIALLEAERAGEGRRRGLAGLRLPLVPAWAWGAALGGAVAAVIAVAPRPPVPPQHMALTPPLIQASGTHPVRLIPRAPLHNAIKTADLPKKPSLTRTPHPESNVTAHLPSSPPDSIGPIVLVPAPPVTKTVLPSVSRVRPIHLRAVRRTAAPHHLSSAAVPKKPVTPAAGGAPAERRPQATDDLSHLAQNTMPASTDPDMPPASTGDSSSDTNGMTLMASGGTMPPPPEAPSDDLTELRRRLDDRPLQIPELGQLKPASGSHANHDGWIRF